MPEFLSFVYLFPGQHWTSSYPASGFSDHALQADGLDPEPTLLHKLRDGNILEMSHFFHL